MTPSQLAEHLLGLPAGESVLVGDEVWTSLDDADFEVVGDFGEGDARFVRGKKEMREDLRRAPTYLVNTF